MILHIKIPQANRLINWIDLIENYFNDESDIDKVIIDFDVVNFLNTNGFVLLSCLIESFYIKNIPIEFVGGSQKFQRHLKNVKFQKYWSKDFNRNEFNIADNKSTVCLWNIKKEYVDAYSVFARQYFESTFFNNKDLIPLSSNLAEVFNNIFDHSESKVSGYVLTQYLPSNKKMELSVCDFGNGIANTINTFRTKNSLPILNDDDAIELSLKEGYTSQSREHNKGMGLSNIFDFIKTFQGELFICSNRGFYYINQNQEVKKGLINKEFKGTLIYLSVDTKFFEEIDTENDIFSF